MHLHFHFDLELLNGSKGTNPALRISISASSGSNFEPAQ
jgi:hypothetical protein